MAENISFADLSRVVYRGSHGIKIFSGPVNRGFYPRKQPEMLEIASFADASRVVYRGSKGIEILPGPENHWL